MSSGSGPKLIVLNPPKELEFNLSRTESSEQKLTITNVHSGPIAFKVKTTAPKAYLVRPSNDMLPRGESIDIQIFLQPNVGRETPHRFLVQAVALPEGKNENLTKSEWTAMDKALVFEQRLSVREPSADFGGLPPNLVAHDPNNLADLQKKYDELVKYVLNLETQTQQLEEQRDQLREKAAKSRNSGGGYSALHVFFAVIIVVVLSKLPHVLGMAK